MCFLGYNDRELGLGLILLVPIAAAANDGRALTLKYTAYALTLLLCCKDLSVLPF